MGCDPSLLSNTQACPPAAATFNGMVVIVAAAVGGIVVFLLLIAITITASIAVCMKTKTSTDKPRSAIVLSSNEAYGMLDTSTATTREKGSHTSHPEVENTNTYTSIEVKQNRAYGIYNINFYI